MAKKLPLRTVEAERGGRPFSLRPPSPSGNYQSKILGFMVMAPKLEQTSRGWNGIYAKVQFTSIELYFFRKEKKSEWTFFRLYINLFLNLLVPKKRCIFVWCLHLNNKFIYFGFLCVGGNLGILHSHCVLLQSIMFFFF